MDPGLRAAVESALGRPVREARALTGGCVSCVYLARTEDGPDVVVKAAPVHGASTLMVESRMLAYLAARTELPVPRVLHADDRLLILEHITGRSEFDDRAERHAADLLANLHGHSAESFGFDVDTVIGPLPQRNPWTGSWARFFAEQRLRPMADDAVSHGMIGAPLCDRVHRLADAAERLLTEPESPALLHGDVWAGNVLATGGRITAFLDPAIYYGHPEVELAFITLFGTFGPAFFERYSARRAIAPGFFERRATVYNVYPLLVHARLFGGSYPAAVERALSALGF